MGQDNTVPRRINGVEGAAGQVMQSGGPGAVETWVTPSSGATLVYKPANETVNNSVALQNDDDLLFAMGANEIWEFTMLVLFNATAFANMKVFFALPVGATVDFYSISQDPAGTIYILSLDESAASFFCRGLAAEGLIGQARAIVFNGGNAGNMQVQWAQNNAEVSNTIMLKGACLIAHQLA